MSGHGMNSFLFKQQLADLVFFSNTELSKSVRFFYELDGQAEFTTFCF